MSRKTRNLIWSVPLVATLAIVGALALFVALTPNDASAQADTAPGRPGTLEVVAFDDGTPETEILLTWSAPTTGGSPTHYRIDQSTNGGNTWTALRSNVNDTRFLHTGLKAGETFHYQVFAVSGQLVSPKSNTDSATTDPVVKPEKPDNLVATVGPNDAANDPPSTADTPGELTIDLVWTAPPDPAGAPVLGYVVEYALIETPGSWTELDPADADFSIDGVTAMHKMLDAGRTYRYQVAAYNKTMKVGDKTVYDPNFLSGWASPDSATTLKGAEPDRIAHADVRVGVTPSEEKIFLYWPAPEGHPGDPMGDPVNAYKVEGRPLTQGDGTPLTADDAPLCPVVGADNVCPFVTIKDNIGRPNGTFIHSFEVTVRDVNANTGYNAYFKKEANWQYRIRAKNRSTPEGTEIPEDDQDDAANRVVVPRSTTELDTSVTPNVDVVTLLPLLPEPSSTSLRVEPSETDDKGRTGLALSWNKSEIPGTPQVGEDVDEDGYMAEVPANPADFYRIEYSNTGPSDPGGYDWRQLGDANSIAAVPSTTEPKQTGIDNAGVDHEDAAGDDDGDEDLTAGQTRHYRVFALADTVGNQIMSTPTDGRSRTTANPKKPEPPTALRATAESHTSVKLRWRAPDATDLTLDGSEQGPSVIVGYYIQYLDDGASTWTHIKNKDGGNLITDAKGKAATEYIHEKLVPGSSREYRMAAVNKISTSEQRSNWTELVEGSTERIPPPNEAAGLVVEATGLSTIDMTWLAQAEQPQHAEVTEYVIEHSPDGKEGTFTVLTSVAAMTDDDVHTIHVDTGLSPNTKRYYRVYAKNARGLSDQVSNVASATTDPAAAPEAPSVTASATSDTEITVMWTAPADGGSEITGYMVQRAYMGADNMMSEWMDVDPAHMGMDMMYMDTGLMPETAYYYRVAAMNSVGMGEYSDGMTMATTEASDTAPGVPTAVTAMETSDTEITVTWGSPASDGGADITGYMVQRAYMGADNMMSEWMDVDPAHMGMDMMYMDTGLMPETAYYYRVAAMNSAGMGEYSDGMDMATTEATDTTLGDASGLTATVDDSDSGAITVELSWTAGANANIHWVAGARNMADGTYDLRAGNTYWSQADMDGSHSVDTMGLNSGTYSFTVIAGQLADDDTENWGSEWVTPFAKVELP